MESKALKIQLLGDFQVNVGGRTVEHATWRLRKASHIVKLLALAPRHRLHREQLLDLLWPELPPDSAANNLHVTLHAARRTLDPQAPAEAIALQQEWFVLSPTSPPEVDVAHFEQAAAQLHGKQDPSLYRAAIDLYGGDLLPGDRYEDWAIERRTALRTVYLRLLVQLGQLLEEREHYPDAVATYMQALATDRTVEAAHRGLMRAYAATGAREQALQQFREAEAILRDEVDAAPEEETLALYRGIEAGGAVSPPRTEPPLHTAPARSQRTGGGLDRPWLPEQRTTFVGREAELAAIPVRLEATRLLLLTGAGGIGKTRLALRAMARMNDAFESVHFVELAAVQNPDLVPETIVTAMGIRDQPGQPALEHIARAIGESKTLLVLDNCEHLIDACARIADTLLSRCPNLHMLATSRQPLGVPGESVIRVPPMDTPKAADGVQIEAVDAVRLFLNRARLYDPALELGAHNAATVARICRATDGVPLALELAAARVHALGLEQLAARLSDTISILSAGPRTVDPRHQSLEAALDWSHALLADDEQRAFRRLAVFAGGWTIDAAEAVCQAPDEAGDAVIDALFQLVDKSLVLVEDSGELVRYRMLEPVRQYAAHKLGTAGESERTRTRHRDWCLALAQQAERELSGEAQRFWLERLTVEHENLRAALDWSHSAGETEPGLRLATALWRFWELRGHLGEGRHWLELLLAGSDGVPAKTRADAFNAAGNLASDQGRYDASDGFYQQSLALARELDDRARIARVLNNLAKSAAEQGRFDEAASLYNESLTLARELGLDWNIANTLNNLAIVMQQRGEYQQATALLEEALEIWQVLGERSSYAQSLDVLGEVAREQGDDQLATKRHQASLAIRREVGDQRRVAVSLHNLALVALIGHDDVQATELIEEALGLQHELGDPRGTAGSLSVLGHLALMRGDRGAASEYFRTALALRREINSREDVPSILTGLAAANVDQAEQAAQLLGAAAALRDALGATLGRVNRGIHDQTTERARTALGTPAFDAARSTGAGLPIEQVIDIALSEA